MVSGTVGSLITTLAVTPLDVVKYRMQAATSQKTLATLPANVAPCPRNCGTLVHLEQASNSNKGRLTSTAASPYHQLGTFAAMRRIFANEGFAGIYAGLRPTLAMSLPNAAVYYTFYEEMVFRIRQNVQNQNADWIPLVSGGSARLVASTLTAPMEFLRTRQATTMDATHRDAPMLSHLRLIVKENGFTSLFRGLAPTLWRDVPFSSVYWLCMERLRSIRPDNCSPSQLGLYAFLNGAIAGMIAAAVTTPFDVIKTRQQASSSTSHYSCSHDGAVVYQRSEVQGTLANLRSVVEIEGWEGLWRGNHARMIRVAPACAIMMASYEIGKHLLE